MHIVNPYRYGEAGPPPSNDFIMVVETTAPNETFTIPCQNVGIFNATVDWGDGFQSTITAYNDPDLIHTYVNAGEHEIKISGSFPNVHFSNGGDKLKLIRSSLGDTSWEAFVRGMFGCSNLTQLGDGNLSAVQNFTSAWRDCSGLTSFPALDLSSGTNFFYAWRYCSSLTSFPMVIVSNGLNFSSAWEGCSGLNSFPTLVVSSGTDFSYAWRGCTGLTSFPLLDVSNGTKFNNAWFNCNGLNSFPMLDMSSGLNFDSAWRNCSNLNSFPANMFDSCLATIFNSAFNGCALDQTSVDNILVSIDTAGQSNGTLSVNGGTSSPPSAIGLAAKASLEGKGWTVMVNT